MVVLPALLITNAPETTSRLDVHPQSHALKIRLEQRMMLLRVSLKLTLKSILWIDFGKVAESFTQR